MRCVYVKTIYYINLAHSAHLLQNKKAEMALTLQPGNMLPYFAPTNNQVTDRVIKKFGSFPFVPPPQVRYAPPVTEHVPLNSKSLFENMARVFGGCK